MTPVKPASARPVPAGYASMPLPAFPPLWEFLPALADQEGCVLLESGTPGGWTLLAWDPALVVSCTGPRVKLTRAKDYTRADALRSPRELIPFLERTLKEFQIARSEPVEGPPPFVGGFVGYLSYEWQARLEGADRPGPEGVPDAWFGLYDRLLASSPRGETLLLTVPGIRGSMPEDVARSLAPRWQPHFESPPLPELPNNRTVMEDFSRPKFEESVRTIRALIRQGEVYQVNLAERLRVGGLNPLALFRAMRATNPSPFSGFLRAGEFTLASSSPERLFRVRPLSEEVRQIETRPIAGTRTRGPGARDAENEIALRRSPKERAEHTMLVDLSRNDLGRICRSGTVEVNEWMTVERYSHVMHLVSNVRGELAPSVGLSEMFLALMPGGSVTGTPKIRSTEVIGDLEPVPRGAYTGSMGYLSLTGEMDFNLLIRSAFFPGGGREAHVYAGAGIVQDSDPSREWKECRAKAAALLEAGQGRRTTGYRWFPPKLANHWQPPAPKRTFEGRRVLLIDNYDSFTYNLAQYLTMLGGRVEVVRNDALPISRLRSKHPTHVVLSPGPGRPEASGITLEAVRAFEGTPLLGVCLGLEAIVESYGGTLQLARTVLQGKTSEVLRVGESASLDLLEGLPASFTAGRYHSLVADQVPKELRVTAEDRHHQLMALQHRQLPTYGVQFHPESLLTPLGLDILSNFLAIPPARSSR